MQSSGSQSEASPAYPRRIVISFCAAPATTRRNRRQDMIPVTVLDSDTLSELSRGHSRVLDRARIYLREHGRLTFTSVTVFERLRGYRQALREGKSYERHMQQ